MVDKKTGNGQNEENENADEDLSDEESSKSGSSNGDLDEKVEDYIEKKNENKKDSKLTIDSGAQSFIICCFSVKIINRRNGRTSFWAFG